jgi:hypothetical protein
MRTLAILAAFLPIVMAIPLVACGTGAQMESARMHEAAANMLTSSKPCFEAISQNPEYQPLSAKVNLGFDTTVPLRMLNDQSRPTKREIDLLYKVYDEVQQCRKIELEGVSKIHPLALSVYVETYAESDKLWAEATTGKLTWGQFNRGRQDIKVRAQQKTTQANAQVASQLQNQHQFEIEQRQRAAAAFQQWAYQQQALAVQQQAINAANRPRTINCNYYGSTATCNSN